jgi:hypothetical protein
MLRILMNTFKNDIQVPKLDVKFVKMVVIECKHHTLNVQTFYATAKKINLKNVTNFIHVSRLIKLDINQYIILVSVNTIQMKYSRKNAV